MSNTEMDRGRIHIGTDVVGVDKLPPAAQSIVSSGENVVSRPLPGQSNVSERRIHIGTDVVGVDKLPKHDE